MKNRIIKDRIINSALICDRNTKSIHNECCLEIILTGINRLIKGLLRMTICAFGVGFFHAEGMGPHLNPNPNKYFLPLTLG